MPGQAASCKPRSKPAPNLGTLRPIWRKTSLPHCAKVTVREPRSTRSILRRPLSVQPQRNAPVGRLPRMAALLPYCVMPVAPCGALQHVAQRRCDFECTGPDTATPAAQFETQRAENLLLILWKKPQSLDLPICSGIRQKVGYCQKQLVLSEVRLTRTSQSSAVE